ncbi:unnamed protein product [Chilo suppressalis]|uniref:Thyroglobulin type-1 domain-containing protein n=1 Tax=Chilo suppressalis TaxID=168631 RepID=A0ABN8BCW0_CHISP|nr:unnamed protein product [Chilo suppressalis]
MAKHYCLSIVLFISLTRIRDVSSDILCDAEFCPKFIEEQGCSNTSPNCGINNATHSGLSLPSPTLCNCCDFCLPLIGEGEHCSVGGPGLGTTIGRCGHGLTCVRSDDGNICKRMDTPCHRAQDDYDLRHSKGETGALEERPSCDGKGMYASFSCVPTQTCFCQSEEGKRIFGEVLYSGQSVKNVMHCGCSRFHEKITKSLRDSARYPIIGPRCTADGNYNPIQCIDKVCNCVDRVTGEIIEGTEGRRRRIDLDEQPLTDLECYDPQYDLFPQQSVGTPPFNYTTPCLNNIQARVELVRESEELGYNVNHASDWPVCLPDGTFGRVTLTRNRSRICVDERGRQIEDYEAFGNTDEYDSMDCKCAQTSLLMTSSTERPVCCKNGNFRRIQCRRGVCRCVDSDGRQMGREAADVTRLPCYTANWRTC